MYIKHKLASAFYKLSLGLISLYGFWMTTSVFGANAWRLFSTWALIIGAIYYCLTALILALSNKRKAGDAPSAMFEGMLIVAFVIQGVASISCTINDEYLPGLNGFAAVVAYYVLPVLALLDWCLFDKKGQWRAADPFYWLALPLSYSAMIILTANILPSSAALRYPIPFLDYNTYGLWEMLGWLAFVGLLVLIFGYILVLLDAFMGGVISKHIVLPHIRTVPVDNEEELKESSDEDLIATTETQAIVDTEELEAVELDEANTDEPEALSSKGTESETPLPETKPANTNKPKSRRSQPAKTQSAKTAKAQTSRKNSKASGRSKTQPSGGRKINDITKPQTNAQSTKPANPAHNKSADKK